VLHPLACALLIGSLAATAPAHAHPQAPTAPNGTKAAPTQPPTPLAFDGAGTLQYAGTPEFQMLQGGMIDLHFRAGWDRGGKNTSLPVAVDRCLVACTGGVDKTRYAVYVLGDMSGLAIWNGVTWAEVAVPLQTDRWHHLAVLFSPSRTAFVLDGVPAGVVPVGPGSPLSKEPLDFFVGSNGHGRSNFYGEMANLRVWRTPLPVHEIAAAATYTLPVRPDIAWCLSAYADWSAGQQTMKTLSGNGLADNIAQAKNEAPWMSNVSWTLKLEDAATRAVENEALIIAYATRADGYSLAGAAAEETSLASPWWKNLGLVYPMLLVPATASNLRPMGLSPGQCALLTPEGKVVRVFMPISPEFVDYVIDSTVRALEVSTSPAEADVAYTLAQQAEWRENANLVEGLTKFAARKDLPPITQLGVDYGLSLSQIRSLSASFRTGKPFQKGKDLVPFSEAQDLYRERSLLLLGSLHRDLEPAPDLVDYAHLVWEASREAPAFLAEANAYNFIVPLTALDPILAVSVASAAPAPSSVSDAPPSSASAKDTAR
jgi:hypothetical protein